MKCYTSMPLACLSAISVTDDSLSEVPLTSPSWCLLSICLEPTPTQWSTRDYFLDPDVYHFMKLDLDGKSMKFDMFFLEGSMFRTSGSEK